MKKLIGITIILMFTLVGCGGSETEPQRAEESIVRREPEVVTFRSVLDFYYGFDTLMNWFEVDEIDAQFNADGSMTVEISPERREEFSQNLWELIDYNMEWLATVRLVGLERAEMDEELLTMTWYIADEELFSENYLTGLVDFFMHEMGLYSYVHALVFGIPFHPDGFTVVFYNVATGEQETVYRFLDDDGAFEEPQESFSLEN